MSIIYVKVFVREKFHNGDTQDGDCETLCEFNSWEEAEQFIESLKVKKVEKIDYLKTNTEILHSVFQGIADCYKGGC